MRQVEATGKNIEKAIENGLKELNTTMENVDIKILNEGGLLKKAKVLITLSEDEETVSEKQQKTETTKKTAKTKETKTEKEEINVQAEVEKEEDSKAELQDEVEMEHVCENGVCELRPKAKSTTQNSSETKERKEVNLDEVANVSKEFVSGLVYMLNLQAEVTAVVVDKFPTVKVSGDDLGVLIGYRGEALQSIQNLMNVVAFNKTGYKGKVILDVENYRERRVQTLCDLADRIAKQVVKNKKSFKLEPMNSYERRIIHSHLQNVEHITTHSEGKEPERRLVIDYVD